MKEYLFCLISFILINEFCSVYNIDIDFETPHVIVDYNLDSNPITLEAFTTKNIRQIEAQTNTVNKYNHLTWMTLGYPKLLETKQLNSNLSRLFHFYDQGFFTLIETLNKDYKNALSRALLDKYSINVNNSQIINIQLKYFECEIVLYNHKNLRNLIIIGQVKNLNQHPYKMMFKAPLNSTERNIFEQKIKVNEKNIFIDCKVGSRESDDKNIEFELTPKEAKELKLNEKIFQENEFVYLTRYQVDSLSNEIYNSFDILHITQDEFKNKFYQEFINKFNNNKFTYVNFDRVIKFLSKYSLNIDKNISIEDIKKVFSKLFKLNTNRNNSFISIDSEFVDNLRSNNKNDEFRNARNGMKKIIETSVQFVENEEAEWSNYNKRIEEQILELNNNNKDGIEWELNGTQILPKTLNVTKITKSTFLSTKFHFPNVKFIKSMPKFSRSFTINSDNFDIQKLEKQNFKFEFEKLNEKISHLNSN